MKNQYIKPNSEFLDTVPGALICQSPVDGAGGSTSDYGEDFENIFG